MLQSIDVEQGRDISVVAVIMIYDFALTIYTVRVQSKFLRRQPDEKGEK